MSDLTPGQKLIAANEAGEFSHPSEMAKAIDAAIAAETDRCCALIYGHCASDNVAERTVRAIRARG